MLWGAVVFLFIVAVLLTGLKEEAPGFFAVLKFLFGAIIVAALLRILWAIISSFF